MTGLGLQAACRPDKLPSFHKDICKPFCVRRRQWRHSDCAGLSPILNSVQRSNRTSAIATTQQPKNGVNSRPTSAMATPACVCVCVRERERGVCECALSCADQAVHAAHRPGLTAGIQPPDVSSFYPQHHSISPYPPVELSTFQRSSLTRAV